MVLYTLYAKADLEGISSLSLLPDANICISVRNSQPTADHQTRERIVIDPTELHQAEIPNHEKHRSEHASHFALTWEGAQTRSTIRILRNEEEEKQQGVVVEDDEEDEASKGKHTKKHDKKRNRKHDTNNSNIVVRDITPQDQGQFVPILQLECDGLEPYAFHPMGEEFVITNDGGIKVENVDLSNGAEWSDYHLESGTSLVQNFETKFE